MKKNLWLLVLILVAGLLTVVILSAGSELPDNAHEKEILHSTIVFTEICAKNETIITDNDGKYRDYIELYNDGVPVSLKGYTFYDGKSKSEPIGDIILDTGEYRVFFISRGHTGFALNGSGGDTIQLLNSAGRVVAQTNTAALNTDEVMIFSNGRYRNSYDASPGFSNDADGCTLFLTGNQVQEMPLVINEVLLRNQSTLPDEAGIYSDVIELCNVSKETIELGRYFLSDDIENRFAYRLPQYRLEPGAVIVIFCDGQNYIGDDGMIHANFGLSTGETLVLAANNGDYTAMKVQPCGDDVSVFRTGVGQYSTGLPSLGYENTDVGVAALAQSRVNRKSDLMIGEVLLSSAGVPYNGSFCDVVEITNMSDAKVSTDGWYLSDGGDPYSYLLPEATLAPGESIVIRCGSETTGFSLSEGEVLRLTGPDYRHAPLVNCAEPEYGKSISLLGSGEDASYVYLDVTLGFPNEKAFHQRFAEGQMIADLQISEVMSGNGSYLKGPYGTTCDWLELYNASDKSIQLADYFLSDSKGNLQKYRLPEMILASGEYCVIFLSDNTLNLLKDYPVLPMTLAAEGESIYLSKDGSVADYMMIPTVPYDMAYGRQHGSAVGTLLQRPTPGERNSEIVEITASPVAQTPQGCYDGVEYVDVVLCGEGDIYYTTNCSVPTENAKRYTDPIRLSETTVLRVMCREKGKMQSDIVDFTYVINENDNLPVVSVVTSPENLWSDETGIYVMGSQASDTIPYYGANFWMDWEKPASISLFEADGNGFSVNCGIKIYGNYSRMQNKKSLSCFFRPEYGTSRLEYPVFGDTGLDTYESIILRSAGQDAGRARMRDVLITSLVSEYTDVPVQAYKPVVVYLNGEYWGLYYIREKISEHYLAGHYNTEAENMAVVFESDERKRPYWELMHYVENNDMRIQENYDYVCSLMDVDNYIDFLITQIWIANGDMSGNVKFFVSPEGKWTWILFDTDLSLSDYTNDRLSYILLGPENPADELPERTFAVSLLENPEFRDKFLTRMAWHMNNIWTAENVINKVDEIASLIGPDMEKETARWNDNYKNWQRHVENIRQFARERNAYMLRHIQRHFQLTDEQMRSYGFFDEEV